MNKTEERWLEYAASIVDCGHEHRKACEQAGGGTQCGPTHGGRSIRWPGYLGARYPRRGGVLCVAQVHAKNEDALRFEGHRRLIRAHIEWLGAGRSPGTDEEFLRETREAYQKTLPTITPWRYFGRLLGYLDNDIEDIAYANLARCWAPGGRTTTRVVELCQEFIPITELVRAIRPEIVLVAALRGGEGDSLVGSWKAGGAEPAVYPFHFRNGRSPDRESYWDWGPRMARAHGA